MWGEGHGGEARLSKGGGRTPTEFSGTSYTHGGGARHGCGLPPGSSRYATKSSQKIKGRMVPDSVTLYLCLIPIGLVIMY